MKTKKKFFLLYFSMILVFVLRYYLTTQIELYEMNRIDEGLIYLWYLRNGIDVFYYISEILMLLSFCKIKWFHLAFEMMMLVFPGAVLLVTSSVMIAPFEWTFTNSSYCIPFGAMLICSSIYRKKTIRTNNIPRV